MSDNESNINNEALKNKKKWKIFIITLLIAVLTVTVILSSLNYVKDYGNKGIYENVPVHFSEASADVENYIGRDLTKDETDSFIGDINGILYGKFDNETQSMVATEGYVDEIRIISALSGVEIIYVAKGTETETNIGGIKSVFGKCKASKNGPDAGIITMYIDFNLGDNHYYLEINVDEDDKKSAKDELISTAKAIISNGKQDMAEIIYSPEED